METHEPAGDSSGPGPVPGPEEFNTNVVNTQQPVEERSSGTPRCAVPTCQPFMLSWIVIVGYVMIGGLIFQLTETMTATIPVPNSDTANNSSESDITTSPGAIRQQLIDSMRDLWESGSDNWTKVATDFVFDYDRNIKLAELVRERETGSTDGSYTGFDNWWASSFFCLTVVTSIGYGHLTPRTAVGKCVCTIYTIIGVPLFFIYLVKLSQLLAVYVKRAYCRLCNSFSRCRMFPTRRKSAEKNSPSFQQLEEPSIDDLQPDRDASVSFEADREELAVGGTNYHYEEDHSLLPDEVNIEIPFVFILIVNAIFIIVGGAVFSAMEGWPYGHSLYFAIITLSTVGFGDYVPEYDNDARHFFVALFIVTGMLLISVSIQLCWSRIVSLSGWLFNCTCCSRRCCSTCYRV
ncbi:potassium channel subfamily K member 18-like [Saccoglossus kowalevskii]|uniref:Potassium channel subfamily K member 18-like n=1 Tax=Saccoglossus kowalevskii TaxID=10224 RepID=A0ABM0GKS2_SACKO|nr:PREDICTED: potassium channel subfamily K member 18-like [Saccoglossus kowalevskii]